LATDRAESRKPPEPALLAVAGALAVALILGLTDGLTFFNDEWSIILERQDWSLDSLLEPHNEHIYLGPVLIYKVLLAAFGMESTLSFRVVNCGLLVLVVSLVFVYVRRRVGGWSALLAACVLLFLGAAWEDLLWPAGISFLGATAAGVGAFLALDREGRPNDLLACALLVVSVSFSSLGLVFAAGAAVDVATRPATRLRRAYIPVVPVLLYVGWYLAYGHEAESAASLDNLLAAPRYVWEAAGGALASLVGLVSVDPEAFGAVHNVEWGRPLAVAFAIGVVWFGARHPSALSRRFWALAVTAGSFWFLAALNAIPGREPGASRYQLIGSALLLLTASELFRGARVGRMLGWALAALAVASIVSNIGALRDGERFLRAQTEIARADLAALELLRDDVPPTFSLSPDFAGTPFLAAVSASAYFEAVDRWGSPAASATDLPASPESARSSADAVLAVALELQLAADGPAASTEDCETVSGDVRAGGSVPLPPGGAVIDPDRVARVRLRRFARADYPLDLGTADGRSTLAIPVDGSDEPWTAQITSASGVVRVCPL
jgi:hypothetical protein